jgi:hypothetical protein
MNQCKDSEGTAARNTHNMLRGLEAGCIWYRAQLACSAVWQAQFQNVLQVMVMATS